jgi:peptide subunit release factor RF-3
MKKKRTFHKSRTDWSRVDSMSDEDIDFSDIPEVTPELFAKAILRKGMKPKFLGPPHLINDLSNRI